METDLICQCGCDQGIPPNPNHKWKTPRFISGHHNTLRARLATEALGVPPFCECGCGEQITPKKHHRRDGYPRFLSGHYSRVSHPMQGTGMVPRPEEIPSGWCECGCGQRTPVAKISSARQRQFKGYPVRFISGHNTRKTRQVATAPSEVTATAHWVQGRYMVIYAPNHPNARKGGEVMEHRLVMEVTLGRFLEPHEQVHHRNGDRADNRPENLELWKRSQPSGVRAADYHCPGCNCPNVD